MAGRLWLGISASGGYASIEMHVVATNVNIAGDHMLTNVVMRPPGEVKHVPNHLNRQFCASPQMTLAYFLRIEWLVRHA